MRIVSVNVARVRPTDVREQGGFTGIDKIPTPSRVPVTAPEGRGVALPGDETFAASHGGPDQALYAFAREDYDHWERELGRELRNGFFGDNLTVSGYDVCHALIGERWRIGPSVVVQATYARIPCGNFQEQMGDEPHWIKRFTAHSHPGAYLRIVEPGEIGEGDAVTVVHRPDHDWTVAKMFRAWTLEQHLMPELMGLPELPETLRAKALARFGG